MTLKQSLILLIPVLLIGYLATYFIPDPYLVGVLTFGLYCLLIMLIDKKIKKKREKDGRK